MITSVIQAMDFMSKLATEKVFSYAATDTITNHVTALLAAQVRLPTITLGTIAPAYAGLTRSIQADGDSILKVLLALRDTVGGYIEVDNNKALQWYASVGENKGQQIRYRKNMPGIERQLDYSKLYNRIYAYGSGEGTARIELTAPGYVEDVPSQVTWGGIYVGTFVDKSITHPDTLTAWANQLLEEYKNPPHIYRVDTIDLSAYAEFSFDTLQLGSMVNVIDEELGISINARVVKIEHPDLLDPQRMLLEISNPGKDIVDTLTQVYDTQQLQQHIATQIGAGQVIVLGAFTVADWATGGATTINGANIETGTITATKLITTAAVITTTAQIQDAIITSAKIGNLEVKTANIDNLAITEAKIANLAVTNAKINSLAVDKLTAGNLQVTVTLVSGKFRTGASPNKRIEIDNTQIAGYSDAVTKQFYILASDGKAYAGGGSVVLDSTGIHIDSAIVTNALDFRWSGISKGYMACLATGALVLNATGNIIYALGHLYCRYNIYPDAGSGTQDNGSATYRWRYLYGTPILTNVGAGGAAPAVDHSIAFDATNNRLVVRDGGATYYFANDGFYT